MRSVPWFNREREADSINRAVEEFEARFVSGWPSLRQFWKALESKQTPATLAALVKVDLNRRFERGECPKVLDYLSAYPVLAEDSDRVLSLVYEEFCLLQENGYNPDSAAFCEQYQPWRDSLASQLGYHRELSRAVGAEYPSVTFPEPGDRFDKYRLTSILGVGGVARVYLATEDELGGRQLAIKVSASFGQEPSILAKLDHRNIVPIWTVAESESGLRGICMPYRPGLTLEELIKRIGRGKPPRAARAICDALRPRDSPADLPPEDQRVGWAEFPVDRTFPEAVAWIGLALAQALSYLHKQGIYHRDIKPANILLAYREGPQLLDFNLAQVPSNPNGATVAQKGGTLPYMAPEQLRAFLDVSAWGDVEEAADLYSLGLVLRELLTGRPPEIPSVRGSLAREIQSLIDRRSLPREAIREINPGVPPALDSIIEKCLAFRPIDRYASASDLAADLRQFIDRKPLLKAPNPSKIEMGFNWTHRNRHGVVAAVLCSAIVFSLLSSSRRDDQGHREFLRAEICLDSGVVDKLLEAKALFERLHREYPTTARSSLGLAITLRKLNELDPIYQTEQKTIQELIKEAIGKSDSIQVIRERLAKDPKSVALRVSLGIALTDRRQFALAREFLDQAFAIQPRSIFVVAALASLEQKLGNEEQAAARLTQAIEIAKENDKTGTKVHLYRQILLDTLVKAIDKRLKDETDSESRAVADSYSRQLAANLDLFREDDWRKLKEGRDLESQTFWVYFYEGCLLSIQGVLEFEANDRSRSDRLFDEAAERFQCAERLVPRVNAMLDRMVQIKNQVEQMERRRTALVLRP